MITQNPLLLTDSYKASHFLQYPAGTTRSFSYLSARKGRSGPTLVRFFGLQYLLKAVLTRPITLADIDEAESYFAPHGEPFNRAGWEAIVRDFGGKLPIRIRALPEGGVYPTGVPMVTFENTAPGFHWLPPYLEGLFLQSLWYGSTVATLSWNIRSLIRSFLEETADDLSGLPFKLHDFGFRGVSSTDSAALGGAGHLLNFLGTDTVPALVLARRFYDEPMAGFSIPAAEHSTITSWGQAGEFDAYRNVIEQFGGEGKLYACVADSYDLYRAVSQGFGGVLKQAIQDRGGTLVVRPDSGNPAEVSLEVARRLDAAFGSTVNRKGYKVLNCVRVIYGDGINLTSIRGILLGLKLAGYSADNIAFGMGGALLQGVGRDDLSFAQKMSAIEVNGEWRDVFKSPATDPNKRGLAGRVTTVTREDGQYAVSPLTAAEDADALRVVFENGELLVAEPFSVLRSRG